LQAIETDGESSPNKLGMCPYVDKNHLKVVMSCTTRALACDSRRIGYSDGKESLNFLVTNWLHRKILEPLLALLRQGISPDRLALCVAIGVVVGNIPILGISTILCAVIALAFRLNLAAIQIVQAAMAPTQLVLIIPFVRLGEWILRAPPQAVSVDEGRALLSQGVGRAIVALWDAILHAGFAWIIVAPFAVLLFHKLLTPVFERAAARIK
jgi:uncharacterized protein (DUF2062 family)